MSAENYSKVHLQRVNDSYSRVSVNDKTRKLFDAVAGQEGTVQSHEGRSVIAGLLANTLLIKDGQCPEIKAMSKSMARIQDAEGGLTTQTNMGPWVPEAWPLVTAWYADFPLKDLISVQDMTKPLDYLFFSKLKAGTNKSETAVGELVETPLGPRTIHGRYPTGEIFGEEITEFDTFDSTNKCTDTVVAYFPLLSDEESIEKVKVVFTVSETDVTYVPCGILDGKIRLAQSATPTVDSGSYLDLNSGLLSFKEADNAVASTVTKAVVNYVWNLDFAKEDTIPTLEEDIEMVPMRAKPRALAMKWTLFAEFLKKSQFGVDLREDNTKRVLSAMYQFQLRYILDNMWEYNTGSTDSVVIPNSTAYSLDVSSAQVMKQLNITSTKIETNSGRLEGNRIVCGANFKNWLQSLPNTLFQPTAHPDSDGFLSPREIGKYGKYVVYYDPTRAATEAFMTYRGSEWYDASYYLGMFMPIVPTDAIAIAVTVRESFCSMEAHKFHKKNCVVPLNITYAE